MDVMLSSLLCCSSHRMNFLRVAFGLDPLDELGEGCLPSFLTGVEGVSMTYLDCSLRCH